MDKWKNPFLVLSIILIFTNVLSIIYIFPVSGWDYQVYCGAVKAFENNKDPYITENLWEYSGGLSLVYSPLSLGYPPLSFVYPPITLYFFKVICSLDSKIGYYALWIILLLGTFIVTKEKNAKYKSLLLVCLLMSGFAATYQNFETGNIGLIELFLFSITCAAIIKEKYNYAIVFLNLTSLFKILPIVFGSLFLLIKRKRSEILKILLAIIILFIIMGGLSYLLFPKLELSYYTSILGQRQQRSPIFEFGGWDNPTSLLFASDLGKYIFHKEDALTVDIFHNGDMRIVAATIVIYGIFFCGIGLIFLKYIKMNPSFPDRFFVGVLAIMLLLPRLKPYSFTFALIPIYFLIKEFDYKKICISLFIISIVPLLFNIVYVLNIFHLAVTATGVAGLPFNYILGYCPLWCLFFIYVYIVLNESNKHKR